jgi:hypothetical protein
MKLPPLEKWGLGHQASRGDYDQYLLNLKVVENFIRCLLLHRVHEAGKCWCFYHVMLIALKEKQGNLRRPG